MPGPSPLTIDIARLGRRPGSMITHVETVPSPERIGLDLMAIAPGAPIELDLQLQSVSEGVLVTGSVSAPTTGVPHAMASIMTRPNGSGQSIGNRRPSAPLRKSDFS